MIAGKGPGALVIAPTRELAQQISAVLEDAGSKCGLSCLCAYGGVPKGPQVGSQLLTGSHCLFDNRLFHQLNTVTDKSWCMWSYIIQRDIRPVVCRKNMQSPCLSDFTVVLNPVHLLQEILQSPIFPLPPSFRSIKGLQFLAFSDPYSRALKGGQVIASWG